MRSASTEPLAIGGVEGTSPSPYFAHRAITGFAPRVVPRFALDEIPPGYHIFCQRSDSLSFDCCCNVIAESSPLAAGLRISGWSIGVNILLAGGKVAAGILGNSYALVADGIESTADVFASFIVWGGLRIAAKPADADHPYGHGKAEALAALVVALMLLGAAASIAIQSLREIRAPHHAPAGFTLIVLVCVVVIKGALSRVTFKAGHRLKSTALKSDAWHHRSDALTSLVAFIGISIALLGGAGYESADDWAALAACAVIAFNGLRLAREALDEVMDASVDPEIVELVRATASQVEGVDAVEKCRIRKVGLHLAMDIHICVDGELSVRRGHEIAHDVKDRLLASQHRINDVTVHVEPSLV